MLKFVLLAVLLASVAFAANEKLQLIDKGDQVWIYSSQIRFQVNKRPFYVEAYQNNTSVLQFSSKSVPLQLAQWDGVSFQSKIYEGYSFRVGRIKQLYSQAQVLGFEQQDADRQVQFIIEMDQPNIYAQFVLKNVDQVRYTLQASVYGSSGAGLTRVIWGFDSPANEGLYGFGERFVPQQNRKNSSFYNWVEDGGWGFGLNTRLPKGLYSTYIPMPLALSSLGYALWVNTTFRTDWKVRNQQVVFTTETNTTELNLFFGGYPADSLTELLAEVGKSLIPPKFFFGLWEQFQDEMRNLTVVEWPYNQGVEVWRKFIELDIPASLQKEELHFLPKGSQRGQEDYWRNVTKAYGELGIGVSAYFNPMIAVSYTELYDEALQKDYFVKRADGSVAQFYYKGAGKVPVYVSMLDFSNPGAVQYWGQIINESLSLGFKTWMQDYGEYVDPYEVFANGWTGEQMHNEYVNLYHLASYNFFKQQNPERFANGYAPENFYYVRSGYVGSQQNTWAACKRILNRARATDEVVGTSLSVRWVHEV